MASDEDGQFDVVLINELGPKLGRGEKLTSLTGGTDVLYVGTSSGRIIELKSVNGQVKARDWVKESGGFISQLAYDSSIPSLLCVFDGHFLEVDVSREPFQVIDPPFKQRISKFSIDSNPNTQQDGILKIAFVLQKRIHLYAKKKRDWKKVHETAVEEEIKDLVFSGQNLCFSTASEYYVYNITKKNLIMVLPADSNSLLMNISAIGTNEFAIGSGDLAIFIDGQGMATKPPLSLYRGQHTERVMSVFKSPHVFFLGKDSLEIADADTGNRNQLVLNLTQKLHNIAEIEGEVYAINSVNVFGVRTSNEIQAIWNNMSSTELEAELKNMSDLYKSSPDEKTVFQMASVHGILGIRAISEGKWEDAFRHLEASDKSVQEVLSHFDVEDVATSSGYKEKLFFHDYLGHVLKNEEIPDELRKYLKATYLKMVFDNSQYSTWSPEQHLKRAEILEENGNIHLAAPHFLSGEPEDAQKAAEIWQSLIEKKSEDVSVTVKNIIECLTWPKNKSNVKPVLKMLVASDGAQELLKLVNYSSKEFRRQNEIMGIAVALEYLDMDALKAAGSFTSKLHRVILQLIEEIIPNDDEEGKNEGKIELRSALLQVVSENSPVLDEIKKQLSKEKSEFEIELSLINSKINLDDARKLVQTLIKLGDLKNAGMYCELNFANKSELVVELAKACSANKISPPLIEETLQTVMNNVAPKDAKDSHQWLHVWQQLPPGLKLKEVSNNLLRSLELSRDMLSRVKLADAAQKAKKGNPNGDESKAASKMKLIPESAHCSECARPLDFDCGTIAIRPNGDVCHFDCVRRLGIV
ncbi:unnamed protein product [Caenorhabditis auriculariae]|uniref:CNH domain-containing protein n=1 Tax=Caenorhabditis auriculariae TaxID=2777116 RepID=A0A8S1H6K6_9PELO|nr:unnamed protein product [Caenorhabditis auriculariae]